MSVKEDLEERLAFLKLTEADLRLLADLRPLIEAQADGMVDAFYRHLLGFESTRRILADPAVKERLLQKQRDYLLSLAGPMLDEAYVAERLGIGEVHSRLGLEPRWYLGAYAQHFAALLGPICEAHARDPERAERTVSALGKLLILDAQLAMEAYIRDREAELDYLNRELATLSRQLAQEVERRSASLRLSERRARAAEELASVATLVAGLAHEVGTPLGVIRGHAEALESAVEGERPQWRVRTIREQIDRISKIIEALLNIARPKQAVRLPVHLEQVVSRTLAFVSEELRRRGITSKCDCRPVPPILGDPEKLEQLFLNLVLNASDAMPEGGALRIRVDREEADRVSVRVSDTGVGIEPDALARIFDPFFTTKPAGRGSGLGLVVARGIVLDHGGEIHATSRVGHGTQFRIVLPLSGPEAPAAQIPEPASRSPRRRKR